tara:strand:+ start:103 stop:513 length:411 start_codon:yes stop_codon:yes gene_type:complete
MEREYPVPGTEGKYIATESGEVYSYKTGKKKILKQSELISSTAKRRDMRVGMVINGKPKTRRVSRVVLSAKLNRVLEIWEHACHIDGNHLNNTMQNLQAGCFLNNIIDDIENGSRQTSKEEIDRAIQRLIEVRKSL